MDSMIDRMRRAQDHENFRRWRLSRMTFWGLLLESFLPSPPTAAEMNYYFRTFDTDGIPYVVKAQRAAMRNPIASFLPLPLTAPNERK